MLGNHWEDALIVSGEKLLDILEYIYIYYIYIYNMNIYCILYIQTTTVNHYGVSEHVVYHGIDPGMGGRKYVHGQPPWHIRGSRAPQICCLSMTSNIYLWFDTSTINPAVKL